MSLDPLLPIAPARVKALLLPLGQIRAERFTSFVDRLNAEHVVHLRDISADGRPNRNMFSPLAYPDGVILYDLITHVPPPSHLILSPFDLYREPMAVIALADGTELEEVTFSKRHSANGTGPTIVEKNIRALYQDLEDLRDNYPKALVHQVLIFDHVSPKDHEIPLPEGIAAIPPTEDCKRTTMKTVMCDISSLLLAEMTTLARSFEVITSIESPGHYSTARHLNGGSWGGEGGINGLMRRSSQLSHRQLGRSNSASGIGERNRMSMPPVPSRSTLHSSSSTPGLASTPVKSGLSNPPINSDGIQSASEGIPTPPERSSRPETPESGRDASRDRVSVQGFGPGGVNERWRMKGKGRTAIVVGSMYLQAGRWSDSLKELAEGAAAARTLNDHIWNGKAQELILINLLLLGWSNLEFQVPTVCLPPQERPSSISSKADLDKGDADQPKHLRHLQAILPDLLDRIIGLYTRVSAENLPPLPLSETHIRFARISAAIHLSNGKLNQQALDIIVTGKIPSHLITTSPRVTVTPSRQQITTSLFKAFPSSASELLTTVDRASILSGMAAVLGPLGLHRKKAMVIRELVSVLISGLVEARTRGAADMGIHPAAGLVSLTSGDGQSNSGVALDLGEGDLEQGIEALLGLLCRSYGIVSFDLAKKASGSSGAEVDDSDESVIARINGQSCARFFGFLDIKLNILRACINFSEALPDFSGVLRFSSDLLRTAGSGIAPGPRREDASPMIDRDEQVRLATNISRTSNLVSKLGLSDISAEYWDEFLVREIKLEAPPTTKVPIPRAKSVLPGATASRASQDVNPFIYNPFLKQPDEVVNQNLVAGELATFKITLQNPYDVEVDVESIKLHAEDLDFEAIPESTIIGPYRTQVLRLRGRPKGAGNVKITGAVIKVRGCRERRFPIFSAAWTPSREEKTKARGLAALDESVLTPAKPISRVLETESLSLTVIEPQPLVVVKSTSLAQSSLMILEGERQVFSVTLQNLSSTPVDFMLFSFKDSTQEPLQAALDKRDATPADLYEYELILMKKQALRLPKSQKGRNIAPGGEAVFEFEIFGKPGLTHASIQVDYTHLGCPQDQVTEQFYTRKVSVDLTITVNASVELTRMDALPINDAIPQPLWERLGNTEAAKSNEYCLLSMDLRNTWPSQISVRLESDDGMTVEEDILPGFTNRVVLPVKRVYLEDPHATIPTLNPTRNRQFVVSTSKISPETERTNREAFWYRERILDSLKATWRTPSLPRRNGTIELRSIKLTPRMVEAIKVDEIGIDISVEEAESSADAEQDVAYVDEFMRLKVHVTNRTTRPIYPLVRIMPALCHRPANVALEFTRKFAWNGTLQQLIPMLEGNSSTDVMIGMTALCRGEFEITASVEEIQVWENPNVTEKVQGRPRSDTETMMEAALGVKERRIWHSRQPCMLMVRDREEKGMLTTKMRDILYS